MAYIRVGQVWVEIEVQTPGANVNTAFALIETDTTSANIICAFALVEVDEPFFNRVTTADAYVETTPDVTPTVTTADAYVETTPDVTPTVTTVGAYVETTGAAAGGDDQTATSVAAYIEQDGGDSQSATFVGAYAEIDGGDSQSATFLGAYLEQDGEDYQSATQVSLYLEIESGDGQTATSVGAYVELDAADNVSATVVSAYLELETPPADYVSSTHVAAYLEITDYPSEIVVSKVVALLGTEDGGASVSQFGTYVEYTTEGIYATKFGVLVEIDEVDNTNMATDFQRVKTAGPASHIRLPSEVVGYALDPSWSFWTIITPEATENLILNPSFEENNYADGGHVASADWASTVLVEGAYPYAARALRFVRLTPDPAQATAEFYYEQDVVAGQIYTWSLDLFLRLAHIDKVKLRIQNGVAYADVDSTKTLEIFQEGWQRHFITWTARATETVRLNIYVTTLSMDNSHYVGVDGWQLEKKAYPTTYADGSMFAPNDTANRRHFYWTGRPNLSTSHRTVDAEGHGRIRNLSEDFLFYTTSIIGLGMINPQLLLKQVGTQGVEVYQGAYDTSRDFTIIGVTIGCDFYTLMRNRDNFIELLRSNKNNSRTQLKIRWQPTDFKGVPWGVPLEILCAYRDGLGGQITNLYQETLPVQFHAADPYLEESIEMSALLTLPTALDAAEMYAYRDVTGSWQLLVGTEGVGPFGRQFSMEFDYQGRPVAGGDFSRFSGNNVDYIAYWDGTDWVQYGSTTLDGQVDVIHRNTYDSQLIIAGTFTNVGNRIARYSTGSGDWTSMGTITGDTYSIDSDERDFIYIAGDFLGGLGRAAVWTGSLMKALGDGFDDIVWTIKVGKDGYVYVAGQFTEDLVANPMDGVARWNLNNSAYTDAWENIGMTSGDQAYSMDIGPDGNVYCVVEDVGGQASLRKWDGNTWTIIAECDRYLQGIIKFDNDGVAWVGSNDFNIPGDNNLFNRLYSNTLLPVDLSTYVESGPAYMVPYDIAFSAGKEMLVLMNQFASLGSTLIGGESTTVTYAGTANVYPTICVYGPCYLISVVNHSTGGEIWFRNNAVDKFYIALDEELYIYLDGGRMRAWSSKRGNVSAFVHLSASNLGSWYLRPGENNVSVYCTDTNSATRAFLKWRNRYLSMDSTIQ